MDRRAAIALALAATVLAIIAGAVLFLRPAPITATASAANLSDGPFEASTTSFGVGPNPTDQTACGCLNPTALLTSLETIDWYGVATPAWLGSPYSPAYPNGVNCGACPDGGQCNSNLASAGDPYFNCASGPGGCGSCLELTVLDQPNIYGAKSVPAGTKINGARARACAARARTGSERARAMGARSQSESVSQPVGQSVGQSVQQPR